jgi:uncharacterized protein YciI
MLYVIMGIDAPNSEELRRATLAAHMRYLENIAAAGGRIVLAGPCLTDDSPDRQTVGYFGGLLIAEFESLEKARAWSDADPFVTTGVFSQVFVKPFRQVVPAP